ncbi:ABC transporter substrate-binding protein [Roseomonas marmotae]|uniref:ABC transporter substrate-binding protein n=1 Tax=Roseomonas marmotae TaxID=2768161 RepID=A0ABS3KCJ2_9PROT|nr:ABC transporter substrate-binding protein [Roseomonas marmotae]MBO1075188.1 ABC transporter substrate-binding protein [Roseomonas marmotae]QTI79703.1 ABC transporter substrate-binding protein [Roseomonas marmotae]
MSKNQGRPPRATPELCRLDRRQLLQGAMGTAVALALPGSAFAQGAKEAPDLAKLVADKKLPPLAERLPSRPLVVPVEKVGRYGGTLRRGLRGSSDHNGILKIVGNQGLVRWNLAYTEVLPCVAEKWDVNAEATEFVFHLRPGMRWSDGHPFTADDIVFAIEDCAKNPELFRSPPSTITIANAACTATKIDDNTVRFTFKAPYATFLEALATPLGQYPTLFPRHYCSRFHPKYNPEANNQAKAANMSDWAALFRVKCGDVEIPSRWGNPEKPVLDPWVIAEPYTGGATRVVLERNPYFWQVDTAGNQLPYIDRLNLGISQDVESLMIDAVSGKLDIQDRHIDSLQNKPTLSRNMQKGNYHLVELIGASAQQMQIYLNITHKDPAMRAMFSNKRFRQALSHGINRAEIIELVYLGQSEPYQTGPRPGHPWYHEKLARQFTEYDQAKANAILDEIGYNKRDAQNFRLRPDGQKIFFSVDVIPTLAPDQVDALELVKRHWSAIGVDIKVNTIERALYYTRGDNNDHDAATWSGPGGLDPMMDPRDYFAQHPQGTRYGLPWALWYVSGGKDGMEPPEHQKKRMQLFDQARGTADLGQRAEIMKQVFDIAAEEFESFGICLYCNSFGVVSNKLQNVPPRYPNSWSWPNPGPALPQQFFFT